MSNPRNIRFYDELEYHGTTYQGDNTIVFSQVPTYGTNHSAQIGLAVTVVAPGQIGLGATGNALLGKLKAVEADLNVTVQDAGYMTLAYPANDGTAPVLNGHVCVNGAGQVINAAAGGNTVISIDTVGLTCIVRIH
ncbi:MAG: hypothetical protein ACRYFS_16340 [Janthinobacterium lividum]